MAVAGTSLRGAARIIAVGTRPNCIEAAKAYGASDFVNYKDGDIAEQVMELTNGKGVDKVIVAGGNNDTFETAVKVVKPGGTIGNVNYLGEGTYIQIPRVEWGLVWVIRRSSVASCLVVELVWKIRCPGNLWTLGCFHHADP